MLAHFDQLDYDEISPELVFCGKRPFGLSQDEQRSFMNVSRICYENICEQINKFVRENEYPDYIWNG